MFMSMRFCFLLTQQVFEYRLLTPRPFLIRMNGCTLYGDARYVHNDDDHDHDEYSEHDHKFVVRDLYVDYLPCRRSHVKHSAHQLHHVASYPTVIAFDMRRIKKEEALYAVVMRFEKQ
jgi:hypothetical protein